ncbi:MAG: hypothetical protein JNK65_05045, partial [Deltaproteobacteria bacterium]|nr:hypothetical protein [Deltaproteobacteria bacterium]
MAFELDPIFHTPTMVKILKAQGFFQLATKVCGKILELDPTRIEAKRLWEDLKKPHTSSELASSEI